VRKIVRRAHQPTTAATATKSVRVEHVAARIHVIWGENVMLDADLAELYGVLTKNLNLAVRRNLRRFPSDFMFQLSPDEATTLRLRFATSNIRRGGRRYAPYAFTEQGVAMLFTHVQKLLTPCAPKKAPTASPRRHKTKPRSGTVHGTITW